VGWFAVRKLVLFTILLLAANLVISPRHWNVLWQGLFVEAALVGLVAALQFVAEYQVGRALNPGQIYVYMRQARAHGLMGHWMNFGGQQMLVFVAFAAFLLLAVRLRKLWWLVGAVIAVSIILNFSRGVWLGSFIACIYLVARWRPRWLMLFPVLLLAGYFISPSLIRERLQSVLHLSSDPSIGIRFEMWRVGWRMIQSHPFLGVGPNNIPETYTLYLPPGVSPMVGYREHLHNDYLQLGAERGVPCLLAWLWFMGALGWHTLRVRRQWVRGKSQRAHLWIADAAFACLLALLTEGCFEFNFGTSPVLMVFLFMVSAPFAVERAERFANNPSAAGESPAR
jgi:O-antigen ligase